MLLVGWKALAAVAFELENEHLTHHAHAGVAFQPVAGPSVRRNKENGFCMHMEETCTASFLIARHVVIVTLRTYLLLYICIAAFD